MYFGFVLVEGKRMGKMYFAFSHRGEMISKEIISAFICLALNNTQDAQIADESLYQ